ncbi:hypothetical protein [Streptomyces sp. NPDC048659]|uniref:hypothetical protein n=1 Tax=Streptomyces sp. NPDC048659 TaxID=3155489 RepID=UPI0034153BD0
MWPDPDGSYSPPPGHHDDSLPTTAPADQMAAMDGPTFFADLTALLATTPLDPPDADMAAKLDAVGVLPGSTQPLPDAAVLEQAVTDGQAYIAGYPGPDPVNGWSLAVTGMGAYGTDYGQRAYIALTALGANLPQDALYPSLAAESADEQHRPLRYTLTFAEGEAPPVGAFW